MVGCGWLSVAASKTKSVADNAEEALHHHRHHQAITHTVPSHELQYIQYCTQNGGELVVGYNTASPSTRTRKVRTVPYDQVRET